MGRVEQEVRALRRMAWRDQVARALLSGRAVTLPNGETVELNQWRIQ